MSYFRLLDAARQFFDDNGDPLSGGKLYTYSAGSTSNKATYQDSAGSVAHANPVVLDSAGRIPAEVWGTTGAYKLRLDTSADVTVWTRDNVEGINDAAASAASEWVSFSGTPTFSSGTVFTLSGDQTTAFHVGRRVRWTDSGGTGYGTITASSYSDPTTTITVRGDAGDTIDSGLSAIAYGLVGFTNTSSPSALYLITSGAVSAAASLDIAGLSSTYAAYVIKFWGLQPATNDVGLYLRTDSDAGASFDAGSTDYRYYAIVGESGSAVTNANGGTGAAQILLTGGQGIGNVGGEQADGEILIVNPSSTVQTNIFWRIGFVNGDGTAQYTYVTGGGRRMAAAAVDAVQFILSSGNITAMNYAVYGVKA